MTLMNHEVHREYDKEIKQSVAPNNEQKRVNQSFLQNSNAFQAVNLYNWIK